MWQIRNGLKLTIKFEESKRGASDTFMTLRQFNPLQQWKWVYYSTHHKGLFLNIRNLRGYIQKKNGCKDKKLLFYNKKKEKKPNDSYYQIHLLVYIKGIKMPKQEPIYKYKNHMVSIYRS